MGMFGRFGGGLFGGGINLSNIIIEGLVECLFDNGPSTKDKVEMLFTDVETEGKKQGYDRAAKEYGVAYQKIEREFKETKEFIENQKNVYGTQAYQFIERLEVLEEQKEKLEKQVNSKVNDVSRKYNIPVGEIKGSMAAGTLLAGGPVTVDILGIIYSYKEKKLRHAEQRGYAEAKELYETKIQKLKDELQSLKEKGNSEIKKLLNQILEILDAIAVKEMQIAELKILL